MAEPSRNPSGGPGADANLTSLFSGEDPLSGAFAVFLTYRSDVLRAGQVAGLRTRRANTLPAIAFAAAGVALEATPCWSTASTCAYKGQWNGRTVVLQATRDPIGTSDWAGFDKRVREEFTGAIEPERSGQLLAQFREWMALGNDPVRERAYLEAIASLEGKVAAGYPKVVPELCGGKVLAWEWVEGEPVSRLLAQGSKQAAGQLAELVLEQILTLNVIDAELDLDQIVSAGGRLVVRRANRLVAVPAPQVRTAMRYVAAVLSGNSPVAARALLKLAWGRDAAGQLESKLVDELAHLTPELKGRYRFPPSAAVFESNWRALARLNGSAPLFLDSMHRNLIAVGYWNSEILPGTDAIADSQPAVLGRLARQRLGNLFDRQTIGEWVGGSGLLVFETFRQMSRFADEFRENELAVGVDARGGEEDPAGGNQVVRQWILAVVLFVVFAVAVRWAAMAPAPWAAACAGIAIAAAGGLFWSVARSSG